MFVYVITNEVNEKRYVGQTVSTIPVRWELHLGKARGHSRFYLYRAMRKYGVNRFSIAMVETVTTIEALKEAQKRWIRDLGSDDPERGYNVATGDESSPEGPKRQSMARVIPQHQKNAVGRSHKDKPKSTAQRIKTASHWDFDRREKQAGIARRVNAIENAKRRDYICDLCETSFTQIGKSVFGGHRKSCMKRHNVAVLRPEPIPYEL
jgi:group I intron endonuclease